MIKEIEIFALDNTRSWIFKVGENGVSQIFIDADKNIVVVSDKEIREFKGCNYTAIKSRKEK